MLKKVFCYLLIVNCYFCIGTADASLLEYERGDLNLKLTGEGMLGGAAARDPDDNFIYDFRIRAAANYQLTETWKLGAVYSYDELTRSRDKLARDAFVFIEGAKGRLELGQTSSISSKLGLGLPDVGALRLNDYSIVYEIANPGVPLISNPIAGGSRYALRANIVSAPTNPVQVGASFAPKSDRFNAVYDIGLRYRKPEGKTKTSMSFGVKYIDAPDGLITDHFAPRLTADWRAALISGLNVQYNSWQFGANAQGIYDRNPIGIATDGLRFGAGASYDLLKFSASVSYIFSDTGIWEHADTIDIGSQTAHTGVVSLRYKINEYFDIWTSGGLTATDSNAFPFISAGVRGKF
ncbi:MAG: porin [Alphaproteobacteria bacterium]|nr:porin [Alphaproteobacteria bacterium]